jgi:hypothetical protein
MLRDIAFTSNDHSSSKFAGSSPNDFKIVASLKLPMFGSPLCLKARAPTLAASSDMVSARRIAAPSSGSGVIAFTGLRSSAARSLWSPVLLDLVSRSAW